MHYVCEYCAESFDSEFEATEHEKTCEYKEEEDENQ